jgi:hypothetical protein
MLYRETCVCDRKVAPSGGFYVLDILPATTLMKKITGIFLKLLVGLAFVALILFVYVWTISAIAGSNPLLSLLVAVPLVVLFYWIDKRFNILGRFNSPEHEKRKKIGLYFKALTQTDTFRGFKDRLHLSSSDIEALKLRVEGFFIYKNSKSIDLFLNNHLDDQGHIRTKGDNDFMFIWVIRTLKSMIKD